MFEEAVRARALWCAAMGAVLLATPSFAGTLPPDDSFSMLQEQLTVTAANRRPQPVSETPSAVSVITAAEIRAHGYHTLGEALSWVRGLYTRYDRNYTYLGVRGLQRPGDYNNKVLLTIDGHTMNSPIYGDAAFGGELGLDLERVERIEVVRGPGSTLYGSNAVLAVVNVVTYAPRATPGIEADVRTGQEGDHRGYLALSSARGDRPHLALSASWDRSRGADLFYPEFASTPGSNGLVRRADGERSMGMLGLLTWRDTWLSVKVNERLKNVPTASFGTAFGDPGTRTSDGHDFAEWGARTSPARTLEMESRIYWDASRYWGDYIYDQAGYHLVNHDLGYSDLLGFEVRANWRPGPNHIATLGTEGRWIYRALQYSIDANPFLVHSYTNSKSSQSAAYVQDEFTMAHRARLTAGVRLDNYSRYGNVASPRLDLVLPLRSGTTWKLLTGSAYRAPAPFETIYAADDQIPNPDLLPERVTTLESCLEQRLGPASVSLSVYGNWIRDLVDVNVLDSLGTFQYYNRDRVRSVGTEGEFALITPGGTRARVDVAWQQSREVSRGTDLSNSPRWNGHVVLTRPELIGPAFGGFGVRWLSSRTTMRGTVLPSVTVVDTRVGVRWRTRFDLAVEARNLLDEHYSDPAASEHVQDAIPQDGRGLFVTVGYRRAED